MILIQWNTIYIYIYYERKRPNERMQRKINRHENISFKRWVRTFWWKNKSSNVKSFFSSCFFICLFTWFSRMICRENWFEFDCTNNKCFFSGIMKITSWGTVYFICNILALFSLFPEFCFCSLQFVCRFARDAQQICYV